MLGAHEFEGGYADDSPNHPSRLKKTMRFLGKKAYEAIQFLGTAPNHVAVPGFHVSVRESSSNIDTSKEGKGREAVLPPIYNYSGNREVQPNYRARIHSKKGEQVIPLERLNEGFDSVMMVYEVESELTRRYVIFSRDPNPLEVENSTGDSLKLSIVYERSNMSYKDPTRFTCHTSRQTAMADPHLSEEVIIGGNYGNGAKLVEVVGMTPQHDKVTSGLLDATLGGFGTDSDLSQRIYGVEGAIARRQEREAEKSRSESN